MSDKKSNKIAAVILAGEMGGELLSETPLLLHPLSGQPIINYGIIATREAIGDPPILVSDEDDDQLRQLTEESTKHIINEEGQSWVEALMQVEQILGGACDTLLVMRADMPLLTAGTIEQFVSAHLAPGDGKTSFMMLTFQATSSQNYDRLERGMDGSITGISDDFQSFGESRDIFDYDTGVYCFTAEWLWQALPRIPLSPSGEFRLTDLIQIAADDDLPVQAISLADPYEALRVYSRIHLAEAEGVIRGRINRDMMLNGVTIIDPNTTYIDAQVEIGLDSVIYPNTYLQGSTRIGKQCTIGPNSLVVDTTVGDRCEIKFSVAENAILEDEVDIGPYAHLRKGSHLADGVHMGNYGEVKNSYLGPGTKMGHFSYIGDANIGPGVNIGAGVITANYDGQNKYPTEIGAGAFIGSDSMLIAPVKIGAGSRTGAGSVVTKDVPPNSLAVGIPARVIRKIEEKDGS
jgi:bifunctional UDP-N-acetylglucosamine pyrophosphorylase/glucosamine-1-phosphate N-acetyltransferase